MIRIFLRITILQVLWILSIKTYAQETLSKLPQQWSLADCIEYAKENNLQVRTIQLNEAAGKEDLLQARAAQLPSLSGSISQNFQNAKAFNNNGELRNQANMGGNYGVNSSLTLYNGGYLRTDIKSRELLLQSAVLDTRVAQNDITLNVTQAYLNILLARENIVYIKDVLTNSQFQYKLGKERFDKGAISRKDLVQLEAQVAADQFTLVAAENNYRLNLVNLKQSLQLPSSYDMNIVVPDSIEVKKMALSLQEVQTAARQTRPEVKNAELGVAIAQTTLDKAQALAKPTISLGAGLATGTSTTQDPKYFTQFNDNFYQSVGLTLSIPIFSRRVNKTAINKSKIQIEQAKLFALNTNTVLDQQVEESYINLQNSESQFEAASDQLKASEESYKITNEQFRLGSINLLELQQQRTLYIQALQSFIQSKYKAVLNFKILDFYSGTPITLD